MEIAGNK